WWQILTFSTCVMFIISVSCRYQPRRFTMLTIHTSLLYLHILLGAIALILYWLPIAVRKGSPLHIKAGKIFYYVMLIVSGSGIILCLIGLNDPVGIYAAGKQLSTESIQRMLVWRIPVSQFLLLVSLLTWI